MPKIDFLLMRGDTAQNHSSNNVIFATVNKIKKIVKFILGPVAQPGRALGFYFTPGHVYDALGC